MVLLAHDCDYSFFFKSITGDLKTLFVQALDKNCSNLTTEKQLQVMLSTLEMPREEIEQRNALIAKLKIWLSQSFPGCHFLPFGSSEISLATCYSDFDLCFLFCSSTGNNRLACLLNCYITIRVF